MKAGLKISFQERMGGSASPVMDLSSKLRSRGKKPEMCCSRLAGAGLPENCLCHRKKKTKWSIGSLMRNNIAGGILLVGGGGGDSAAEAALAITAEKGTTVTISCRNDAIFSQPKDKNRQQVEEAAAEQQKIIVYLNANVKEIEKTAVTLTHEGKEIELQTTP